MSSLEKSLIDAENLAIEKGEEVFAVLTDDHEMHIANHTDQKHIEEHKELLKDPTVILLKDVLKKEN